MAILQGFSFLHCADIHLGNLQYNEPQRFNDFALAFRHVVEYALEKEVDFIIISGDFFHKRAINAETLQQAVELLSLLQEAEIPVIAIEGNHDKSFYLDRGSWLGFLNKQGYIHLLNPFYEEGRIILLPWDENSRSGSWLDICGARIYGLGYLGITTASRLEEALPYLSDGAEAYKILMLHAAVNRLMAHEMGGIRSEQIEPLKSCVDYLALGHIHSRYEVDNWGYNPGSLECVHLDEHGAGKEKGFYYVKVNNQQKEIRYIPNKYRPVYRYKVDLSSTCQVNEAYNCILDEVLSEQPAARAQVQITLLGEVPYNPFSLDINTLSNSIKEKFDCLYVEIINSMNLPNVESLEIGSTFKREDLERHVFGKLLLEERNWEQEKLNEAVAVVQSLKELVVSGEDEAEAVKLLVKYGEQLMEEGEKGGKDT